MVRLRARGQADLHQGVLAGGPEHASDTGGHLAPGFVFICHHAVGSAVGDLHLRRPVLRADLVLLHDLRRCRDHLCADVQTHPHQLCK